MRSSTPSLLVVALLSAGAQAAIVGTGGSAVQIPAPPSAMFGALTGAPAWCWDEQQSVMVSGLPVNLSVNPSNSTAPTPGVVNGLVDSHFIHFNDVMNPQTFGSVTFNAPIIGVAYGNFELDASDLASGALGTIYPTGSPMRGVNSTFPVSVVSISGTRSISTSRQGALWRIWTRSGVHLFRRRESGAAGRRQPGRGEAPGARAARAIRAPTRGQAWPRHRGCLSWAMAAVGECQEGGGEEEMRVKLGASSLPLCRSRSRGCETPPDEGEHATERTEHVTHRPLPVLALIAATNALHAITGTTGMVMQIARPLRRPSGRSSALRPRPGMSSRVSWRPASR